MASIRRTNAGRRGLLLAIVAVIVVVIVGAPLGVGAATLNWKGHTWQVTSGGMAGVCQGSPNNVTIDASGYLHFKISNSGGTWTASEMFTTDKLGFGTYQWQVDGPIDTYDKNIVLGLFPYGPAAGIGSDATNEIDIEYSRWGQANGPNGDWTDYPASGTTIGELSYTFTLGGGTLSTSRFHWTNTSIASSLLSGLQPVDGTTGLIKSWTYAPQNPTTNIPQQALPLGMNLWCFNGPPTDGQPVEIVIRDFQFVPEGAGGGSGGGGAAGSGGRGSGGAGAAGGAGNGGRGGMGGGNGGRGMGGGGAGATGRAGSSGSPAGTGGAAGASGAAGARGGSGAAGASGASGTAGASGAAGATGASGTAGVSGVSGSSGASGATGSSGAAGSSAGAAGQSEEAQGCGCAVNGGSSELGVGLLALGCLVLARRSRRRAARVRRG